MTLEKVNNGHVLRVPPRHLPGTPHFGLHPTRHSDAFNFRYGQQWSKSDPNFYFESDLI